MLYMMANEAGDTSDRASASRADRPRLLTAGPGAPFAELAARTAAAEILAAIEARGACALMLSGGKTPKPVYERLAADGSSWGIDWTKVAFYFADERCVAPDHPESNYRMAKESLFDRIPIAPAQVERMGAEAGDLVRAAEEYDRRLPDELDALILGIGEDGHTASLFPGSPALGERERRVVRVESPKPPPCRLTITPPVIGDARARLVLATGPGKAAIVARALEGPYDPRSIPAQLALGGIWILDKDTASLLPANPAI